MKSLQLLGAILIFMGFLVAEQSNPKEDACIRCHKEMDEEQEEGQKLFPDILNDVHLKRGLSCADCHGGNPEAFDDEDEAMWENDTFGGEVSRTDEIVMCGSCHSDPRFMRQYSTAIRTDQVKQYWTSKHGMELKRGNEKVAICTDCHGVHGILPVDDPRSPVYDMNVPSTCSNCHSDSEYMAEFGIPTDQYYKYRKSVHGEALLDNSDTGAPACNDCHGNHGAIPPDVSHISDICGTCHVNNDKLFQESHLKPIFVKRGFGQCEACHGNHGILKPTDEFLNWDHGSVCVQCHRDKGGEAKIMADQFYTLLDSLKGQIAIANTFVEKADQKGMEVSDLLFPLEEAHKVLIQTRTSIHSFNKDYVEEIAKPGFEATQAAITGGKKALEEFDFRRKGLFISSLIITFLALALYLKIKDIEKKQSKDKS
ncbi:MAG: hypothetical protein GXO92_05580 [FCB group bacterium]|nr:hypothetical protein [FCB group bacterium]